jgi:HlyD family secretion protein
VRINVQRNTALAALCCLLIWPAACGGGRSEDGNGPGGAPIPAVEVVQAREGTVPLRERLTGTVRAAGEVAILPQVSGPIVEVMAQNGDRVTRGQPLVRIQAAGARAQVLGAQSTVAAAQAELKQAEAEAREVEADYERNRALGEKGLVPQNTVDTLRAQAEAAAAAVRSAAAQLDVARAAATEQRELQSQTLVRAPISGRVGQRNAEVGMRADPATALFVIGRLEDMRVEVPVAQELLGRIRQGQRAELRAGEGAPVIEAAVSRISPFLESGSFSAEVEIDVPNTEASLIPGMFVTVDIFYGDSAPATLVPASALYEDPATGDLGIYVAAEPPPAPAAANAADAMIPDVPLRFAPIEVVAQAAQTAGVKGVPPGAWVVVVGQHLLARQGEADDLRARPRVMAWDRIMELQQLQREDLLEEFLERQRAAGSGG